MMFVYLISDHAEFAPPVHSVLRRCYERGDTLLTSCLAVGEVLAGGKRRVTADRVEDILRRMRFTLLPFDAECMGTFAMLRAEMRLKAPDAIHLACAAAARTDLFLTNDQQLLQRRLFVPGIQFIGDFTRPIL